MRGSAASGIEGSGFRAGVPIGTVIFSLIVILSVDSTPSPGDNHLMGSLPFSLLCAVGCLAGCGSSFEHRLPDFKLTPTRLVVTPVVASASELDFDDRKTLKPKLAAAMASVADSEVGQWAKAKGAFPLSKARLDECGERCKNLLRIVLHWGTTSSLEIVRNDRERESVGEWSSSADYEPLQTALDADYVLFVVLRDMHETTGRVIGNAVSTVHRFPLFKQVAVACVASLGVGYVQMQWCHKSIGQFPNLTEERWTREAVRRLLSDL